MIDPGLYDAGREPTESHQRSKARGAVLVCRARFAVTGNFNSLSAPQEQYAGHQDHCVYAKIHGIPLSFEKPQSEFCCFSVISCTNAASSSECSIVEE